jgi:hypothetical protein
MDAMAPVLPEGPCAAASWADANNTSAEQTNPDFMWFSFSKTQTPKMTCPRQAIPAKSVRLRGFDPKILSALLRQYCQNPTIERTMATKPMLDLGQRARHLVTINAKILPQDAE